MHNVRKNQRQKHVGAIQITNLDDDDTDVLDGYDVPTTTPTSGRGAGVTNGNKAATTASTNGTHLFDKSLGINVMGNTSRDLLREQKMRLDKSLSVEHRDVLKPDSKWTKNVIDNKDSNGQRQLSDVFTGPKTPTQGTKQNGARENSSWNSKADSVAHRASSLLANTSRPVVQPRVNRNQKGFGHEERDMVIDDIEDF